MKRSFLSLLLVLLMLTGLLAGCGGKEPASTQPPETQPVETTEAAEATEEPEVTEEAQGNTPPASTEGNLLFTFFGNLEIGNTANWGDCTLVTMPDGFRVLIDACEGGYETHIVRQLKEQGVTSIDAAIISHYHSDHYGGLMTFIEEFGIKTVYINAIEMDASLAWNTNAGEINSYISKLEGKGLTVIPVLAGYQTQFGEVTMDVLFPTPTTAAATTNDTSIVFTLEFKGQKALFTGDLYYAGEDICLKEVDNALLKCDLMKVMHHGGNTSGGAEIIAAASPKVAVAMGNHVMTDIGVYRYTKVGCEVYQTWSCGDVNVMLDGAEVTVWTQQ